MSAPPRLLVSVRNTDEARAALAGGCDILDVKEPDRGSLGMADAATIREIAAISAVGLSAALGELSERLREEEIPVLPPGLQYLKVGLAGMCSDADWAGRWRQFLRRVTSGLPSAAWVAVSYADWQLAGAPPPRSVIAAACRAGCAVLLIDTFTKDGRSLFDFVSRAELEAIRRAAREAGLQVALAGSLRIAVLPAIIEALPDIVAIRSAACEEGRRGAAVSAEAVRRFRRALHGG